MATKAAPAAKVTSAMPTSAPAAVQKVIASRQASLTNYLAAVAAITIVIVVITGFVGSKLVGSLILNTKVLTGKVKAKNALDTKLKNAPVLIGHYKDLGSKQALILHALPTDADFPQLVALSESMANDAGVQLRSVSPNLATDTADTASPSAGGAQTTKLTIDVEGSFPRMQVLLQNIERSARPLRVTGIDFKGTSNDLIAELQLTTYYQAPTDIKDKTDPVK